MKQFKIIEIAGRRRREKRDWVAAEFPLTIDVNAKKAASLACTPRDLKDLVVGHLYAKGFINSLGDLRSLTVAARRHRASAEVRSRLSSQVPARRKNGRQLGFPVEHRAIFRLSKTFQRKSAEFRKTGALHSAALCCRDKILIFREDMGRHNALDKVLGAALRKKLDLEGTFIFITSRVQAEIMNTIVRARVPLLASTSAPSDRAIQIARREGVTLVGFARGDRFNIYSASGRVKWDATRPSRPRISE